MSTKIAMFLKRDGVKMSSFFNVSEHFENLTFFIYFSFVRLRQCLVCLCPF